MSNYDWQQRFDKTTDEGSASSSGEEYQPGNFKIAKQNGMLMFRHFNSEWREFSKVRELPIKSFHIRQNGTVYTDMSSQDMEVAMALGKAITNNVLRLTGSCSCANWLGGSANDSGEPVETDAPVPIFISTRRGLYDNREEDVLYGTKKDIQVTKIIGSRMVSRRMRTVHLTGPDDGKKNVVLHPHRLYLIGSPISPVNLEHPVNPVHPTSPATEHIGDSIQQTFGHGEWRDSSAGVFGKSAVLVLPEDPGIFYIFTGYARRSGVVFLEDSGYSRQRIPEWCYFDNMKTYHAAKRWYAGTDVMDRENRIVRFFKKLVSQGLSIQVDLLDLASRMNMHINDVLRILNNTVTIPVNNRSETWYLQNVSLHDKGAILTNLSKEVFESLVVVKLGKVAILASDNPYVEIEEEEDRYRLRKIGWEDLKEHWERHCGDECNSTEAIPAPCSGTGEEPEMTLDDDVMETS